MAFCKWTVDSISLCCFKVQASKHFFVQVEAARHRRAGSRWVLQWWQNSSLWYTWLSVDVTSWSTHCSVFGMHVEFSNPCTSAAFSFSFKWSHSDWCKFWKFHLHCFNWHVTSQEHIMPWASTENHERIFHDTFTTNNTNVLNRSCNRAVPFVIVLDLLGQFYQLGCTPSKRPQPRLQPWLKR